MNFIYRMLSAFQAPDTFEEAKQKIREQHNAVGTNVAAKYARGNTLVQRKAFLMRVDIASRKRIRA